MPARAEATWTTVEEDGGHRVRDADSTSEAGAARRRRGHAGRGALGPPRSKDAGRARSTAATRRGQPTLADTLCRHRRDVHGRTGPTGLDGFRDPDARAEPLSGADASTYVRVVPVDGPAAPPAALAPLGEDWEVIGVMQPRSSQALPGDGHSARGAGVRSPPRAV